MPVLELSVKIPPHEGKKTTRRTKIKKSECFFFFFSQKSRKRDTRRKHSDDDFFFSTFLNAVETRQQRSVVDDRSDFKLNW